MSRRRPVRMTLLMVLVTALMGTTLLASPPAARADDTEANLLANPSFDTGTAPEDLAHWSPWSSRSLPYFLTATDPVSDGAQSLHVLDDSTSYGGGMLSDAMPVAPNTTYEVNLNVHHQSGGFSIWAYFFDDAGTQVSSSWQSVHTTTDTWERAFLSYDSPATAATAKVMVYSGNGVTADVYVDDMYFGLPGQSGHEPPPVLSVPEQIEALDPDISYLGTPVGSRVIRNSVLGEEDGVSMTYGVYRGSTATGSPAVLVVADTLTGEVVREVELEGVSFSQLVARSSDGKIYIVDTGPYHLWVYDPETTEVRDLGAINPAKPSDGYGWALTAGPDGTMYIGTYPNAQLFRYDPADDSITDLGVVDETQSYIHSLAYDEERGNLYVGTGGNSAQVWKIGPDGTKTPLLNDTNAPGLTDLSFVSTFTFVDDRLFARASNQILVINADDEVEYWKGQGSEMYGYHVSSRPDRPDHYIYSFSGTFWDFDATTGSKTDLGIEINGYLNDARWVQLDDPAWPGWTMIAATHDGTIKVNFETGVTEAHRIDHYAPNTVQQIFNGPDQLYASGYLVGLAGFDAATGEAGPTIQTGQYEAGEVRDGKLLLGAYGNARLMEYDPATGANPRQIFSLKDYGQDRPRMDYDPVSDRLFMGTVAHYGHNQGALAMYDFATDEVKVFTDEIVTDQSVISVLAHDGLVYLGTTLDTALGAPPSGQTEGHFIVWDPDTEQVVHDFVVVPGDEGVTGLMVGPDGLIWGVSENTVFKYDPASGEIVYSEPILAHRYGSGTVWVWADLVVGADGQVYGTDRFSFFRIDPQTMEYSEIVPDPLLGSPIRNAELDDDGNVVFSHGPYVFSYRPAPECTRTVSGTLNGGLVVGGGEVVCVVDRARVTDGIAVQPGGALLVQGASVVGGISSDRAATVRIRETSVSGAVEVAGTHGSFVFAGNVVRGSLTCQGNAMGLDDEGSGNTVTGQAAGRCDGV